MAVFKCKMCGGTLEVNNETIAVCEYCGTKQTLPKLDDDRKANLYDRANHFRRNNEFDKAMSIYEQILNDDNTDAESYWSLVLCRYGIEYVEDPATKKRIPTVNRAQFTSVFDDEDYKSALKYADEYQKSIYEQEATAINEIQKGILAISQKEEPFDVFICYKETDNNGRRTPDSVLATELYHELTREGYKVFFSRITLEDKLGTAYEPYIFAALNSAKVMVVLGTRPEYFNAVWVKNEWSRYLALIKNGARKMLIPAYKDMDPYDLPEEFSHLQAQDMSKLGFMQDLIRGIKKIIGDSEPKQTVIKETVVTNDILSGNITALLKRGFMALEDGEWDKADDFFEQALNQNAELAEAYLGKLMVELMVKKREDLKNEGSPFDDLNSYQKVIRFADEKLKTELKGYLDFIAERNLNDRYNSLVSQMNSATKEHSFKELSLRFDELGNFKDSAALSDACLVKASEALKRADYDLAMSFFKIATSEYGFKTAAKMFEELGNYADSENRVKECYEKAENVRKDAIYNEACALIKNVRIEDYEKAIHKLESIVNWRDSADKIEIYKIEIEKIKEQEEKKRLEAERNVKLIKKVMVISAAVICVIIVFVIILNSVIIPNIKYNNAVKLIDDGNIIEAYETLISLGDYKDSEEKANSIYDKYKVEKLKIAEAGDYVFFGTYEQDNNTANGKEDVEWLVLEVKDGKALVISKYALDCKSYNTSYTDVTWETCTLRKWLNSDLINTAFSTDDKAMIPTVTVSADKNPDYITNPGNATQDQIFLLSITEANKYFSSDSARQCKPTEYAVAKGMYVNSSNGNCWWWLRSPGAYPIYAAAVNGVGDVREGGYGVYNSVDFAVRPALWIDLSKIK